MNRLLISGVLFLLLGASPVLADPDDSGWTRAEFELTAAEVPYLPLDAVLHGPMEKGRVCDDVLCRLVAAGHRKEDLVALLTHDDPRVRTLAAAVLFARDDPSVLASLAPLCSDEEETFDASGPPVFSLNTRQPAPAERRQTVGSVVQAMIDAYLRPAGFTHRDGAATQADFERYWTARRDRAFCAGWFAVQLDHASHGIVPTPAECVAQILTVRRRIDAAPPDERAWTLLWLHGDPGGDALATDDELVEAARNLGADKLLAMLRDRFPGDDPDLNPAGGVNWRYRRMDGWILEHAGAIFRPADADALLSCSREAGNAEIRANCAVAAAHLRPAGAEAILRGAMEGFSEGRDSQQRARLAAAGCELCGDAGVEFALDWFYQGPGDRGYEVARLSFLRWSGETPRGRETFAAIIRDLRFGGLDWEPLRAIARTVNGWSTESVIPEDELYKNIAQTKDLAPEWCRELRESVPRWINGASGDGTVEAARGFQEAK